MSDSGEEYGHCEPHKTSRLTFIAGSSLPSRAASALRAVEIAKRKAGLLVEDVGAGAGEAGASEAGAPAWSGDGATEASGNAR